MANDRCKGDNCWHWNSTQCGFDCAAWDGFGGGSWIVTRMNPLPTTGRAGCSRHQGSCIEVVACSISTVNKVPWNTTYAMAVNMYFWKCACSQLKYIRRHFQALEASFSPRKALRQQCQEQLKKVYSRRLLTAAVKPLPHASTLTYIAHVVHFFFTVVYYSKRKYDPMANAMLTHNMHH